MNVIRAFSLLQIHLYKQFDFMQKKLNVKQKIRKIFFNRNVSYL